MSFITISTFCDDIRQEISGKVSLIGLYGSHMFVDGFPVRLPRLCVNFAVVITEDEAPIEQLRYFITAGDKVLHEMSLDKFEQPSETGQECRFAGGVEMPFFESEGAIELEAYFEKNGERVNSGKLIITLNSNSANGLS